MKKMRKVNLHDLLRQKSYDHAFLLTYAFSPGFFENYCLERFNSLKENGNISVLLDGGVYDSLLTPGDDRGFGDFPAKANVRYLLHPIRIPGCFHPKVFLFANEKRGLLIIGSANLTRDGIASNAELAGCYEFVAGEKEECGPLFQAATRYLADLSERFPSEQLSSNLNAMLDEAPWLEADDADKNESLPEFLHNLSTPLWEQIKSRVSSPVRCVHALSRYFDQNPHLLDKLDAEFEPGKMRIYTQNGITTLTEKWLAHPMVKGRRAEILACYYEDEGHPQSLHAKALAFETGDEITLAFGSANFTSAALTRTVTQGNAEVLLLFRGLQPKQFDVVSFFDPRDSATKISSPADLRTAERDTPTPASQQPAITLAEAWVQDEEIRLRATVPALYASKRCTVVFQNNTGRPKSLHARSAGDGLLKANVPPEAEGQLREGANIARLRFEEDGMLLAESNPVLIANVQDFKTGRSIRTERHRQEALQNASRFIGVLRELSLGRDDEALLQFLQNCDIPIITSLRLRGLRHAGSQFSGDVLDMRQLGDRSLRQFFTLHEAVLGFTKRHLRRLRRHVKDGTAGGIPNFMHILLAVAGLLESQMEKACVAFENQQGELQSDQWHNFRKQADAYFNIFEEAISIFASEYIPQMISGYSKQAVLAGLADDWNVFRRIVGEMMGLRDRIETVRIEKLRIQAQSYDLIVPDYFNSVLGGTKWRAYQSTIANLTATLEQRIAV